MPSTWAATATTYTPTGKAWRVTDPDGKVTTTAYDRADRVSSVTDATGRTTAFTYDLAGRKLTEVRGVGSPDQATYATYEYTANGQAANVTDANGNRTGYAYDGHDRLFRTRFPKPEDGEPSNQDTEELTYDAPGNVVSRKTRGGTLIAMGYDALERMTSKSVPAWNAVPARATTYQYDLAGRRTQVSDDWGHSLTWAYADAAGRNTSAGAAGPQWTGTKTISFQYDAASNRTRLTWALTGNYYVEYDYDALNRMDTASEVVSGGTPFQLADFTYDALSRRTAAKLGTKTGAVTWDYSDAGDLLTLAHDLTLNLNDVTYTGTFDAAHRLASETTSNALYQWTGTPASSSDAYVPDRLNRYDSVDGVSFRYDDNQNLEFDGTNTYAYDPENRLLTATVGGVTWNYAYDPLGRRVSKQQAGGAGFTAFLSDGDDEIAEYNVNGATVRRYVPGPEIDRPIAMVLQNGTRSYFHADRRRSIVAMADDVGTLTEGPYSYDAYGAPSATTGVAYKYTGRRYDPETGLYYYRARYYSPTIGRFIQTDPIGYEADLNLYVYVGNDPLNRTDPAGLCDSFVNCLTGGTFQNPDGTVRVESSVILRAVVPGQVAWDNARTEFANGNIGAAAANLAIGAAEQATALATAGASTLVGQGLRSTTTATTPMARGVANEARVLRDMGLTKNTQAVSTTEGQAIPDALTDAASIEIKDAARVSATRQVRIQTDAAAASGRQSVLVTGTKSTVSAPAQRRFDDTVRRDDLGPQ